jgi:hypothetical protein
VTFNLPFSIHPFPLQQIPRTLSHSRECRRRTHVPNKHTQFALRKHGQVCSCLHPKRPLIRKLGSTQCNCSAIQRIIQRATHSNAHLRTQQQHAGRPRARWRQRRTRSPCRTRAAAPARLPVEYTEQFSSRVHNGTLLHTLSPMSSVSKPTSANSSTNVLSASCSARCFRAHTLRHTHTHTTLHDVRALPLPLHARSVTVAFGNPLQIHNIGVEIQIEVCLTGSHSHSKIQHAAPSPSSPYFGNKSTLLNTLTCGNSSCSDVDNDSNTAAMNAVPLLHNTASIKCTQQRRMFHLPSSSMILLMLSCTVYSSTCPGQSNNKKAPVAHTHTHM